MYYIASNWRTLRRALRRYEIGQDDVFIDFGSGMGRMVLEASRFPFKKVIGVELASQLHTIAQENMKSMQRRARCMEIELVNSDILDYDFPDDVTFVYMFNPFRGAIFQGVVEMMIRSLDRNPRTLHLIYLNPYEEPYLLSDKAVPGRWGRQERSPVPIDRSRRKPSEAALSITTRSIDQLHRPPHMRSNMAGTSARAARKHESWQGVLAARRGHGRGALACRNPSDARRSRRAGESAVHARDARSLRQAAQRAQGGAQGVRHHQSVRYAPDDRGRLPDGRTL